MYNRTISPSFAILYTAKCSMKSSGPPISPCKYRLYSVNWIVWVMTWLGLLINMSLIVVLLFVLFLSCLHHRFCQTRAYNIVTCGLDYTNVLRQLWVVLNETLQPCNCVFTFNVCLLSRIIPDQNKFCTFFHSSQHSVKLCWIHRLAISCHKHFPFLSD